MEELKEVKPELYIYDDEFEVYAYSLEEANIKHEIWMRENESYIVV